MLTSLTTLSLPQTKATVLLYSSKGVPYLEVTPGILVLICHHHIRLAPSVHVQLEIFPANIKQTINLFEPFARWGRFINHQIPTNGMRSGSM